MATTLITLPEDRGPVAEIIAAAGYNIDEVGVCPGKADPGCLVALNLEGGQVLTSTVQALIDPKQAIVPLELFLAANANLSFSLFSGETNKTIHPEGTSSNGVFTPGDFSVARLFAQLNPLPFTGPVSEERPLRLGDLANTAATTQLIRGTMIGIAADRKGRIPEAAVRYHLAKWGRGKPDVMSLCANGYRSIGRGYAEAPTEWCDGLFPPGSIVPYQLVDTVLGAGGTAVVPVGPLQPMVPLVCDFTGSGDTLITIDDPQTGKTIQIEGGTLLGVAAAAGATGSLLSPNYLATDMSPGQFQSGINAFSWTTVGMMSRERPLNLNISSAAGATHQGYVWGIVLDKDGNVPKGAWNYAQDMYGGRAVA